jgi:alkylhydroperoxidase family enzyme
MTGSKRLEDFSDRQWAVVRYSDAMTKEIVVSEEVFGSLKEQFSEQEIVELTATVCL